VKLEAFREELQAEFLDFEQDQVLQTEQLRSEVAVMVVMMVMMGGAEDGFAPEEFGSEVVDERLFFGGRGWVGWGGLE
jgi:hypothetical protein